MLGGMFVRAFADVPLPFEAVEESLLAGPEVWVPGAAERASATGSALLAEVGFDVEDVRIGKSVQIELGAPSRLGPSTLLPMTWRATGPRGLFPVLEGDLEVAGLGAERTQVAVSARYRPPLGAVGRIADRALLHRIAEATVKDFVDRVALAIQERTPAIDASAS
jgi:hypothetical protein